MKKLNQKVFDKNTDTDVISLPLQSTVGGKDILGEIVVNTDQVHFNAQKYNVTYKEELARVVAHGVLHLLGETDDTSITRQRMKAIEDIIVSEIRESK